MLVYRIGETLEAVSLKRIGENGTPYAAIAGASEWKQKRALFEMEIEDEDEMADMSATKAVVNFDALIGTFSIPRREDICGETRKFAFALNERGVVFIDDDGIARELVQSISARKKWREPSLERFLYDFIEQIISRDAAILEKYDKRLSRLEDAILSDEEEDPAAEINDVKGELLDFKAHYDQLIDLCQELEENENGFFREENTRYFHLLKERLERFRGRLISLQEYSTQVRELYQTMIDVRQNRIMAHLTVITSIFMPLTLIAGWYGMNFTHMPERGTSWGYIGVIVLSAAIVALSVWYIKKKKWL